MTAAVRLATLAMAEEQLIAAIALAPAGARLSIPRLRDALLNQADILDALRRMVDDGRLDRSSLRPGVPGRVRPVVKARLLAVEVGPAAGVTGADLAAALTEYCKRHGLAQRRVLYHLSIAGFAALRTHRPHRKTVDKIRAFLAAPPPPGLEIRPAGGARASAIGGVTGAELADRLETLIAEHGLSKSRVGRLLTGSPGAIGALRRSNPFRKTVEKIEALLANPPIEELRSKRKLPETPPLPARPMPAPEPCAQGRGKAHGDTVDPGVILGEIRAFLKRSGMAESTFGFQAVNDKRFVHRLRTAYGVRLSTIERVRAFIAAWRGEPKPPVAGRTFEEQLGRVERGEVGIAPNFKVGRPDPSGTLGGVTGEINL